MHHVQVNFTAADSHKDKGWDINMILRLQSECEAAEVWCSKAEAQRAQLMRWRSLLLAADRCFPLLMFLRAQTFSMSAVQLPNEPGISTIPLLLSAKWSGGAWKRSSVLHENLYSTIQEKEWTWEEESLTEGLHAGVKRRKKKRCSTYFHPDKQLSRSGADMNHWKGANVLPWKLAASPTPSFFYKHGSHWRERTLQLRLLSCSH